jgi:hypothetical protein
MATPIGAKTAPSASLLPQRKVQGQTTATATAAAFSSEVHNTCIIYFISSRDDPFLQRANEAGRSKGDTIKANQWPWLQAPPRHPNYRQEDGPSSSESNSRRESLLTGGGIGLSWWGPSYPPAIGINSKVTHKSSAESIRRWSNSLCVSMRLRFIANVRAEPRNLLGLMVVPRQLPKRGRRRAKSRPLHHVGGPA